MDLGCDGIHIETTKASDLAVHRGTLSPSPVLTMSGFPKIFDQIETFNVLDTYPYDSIATYSNSRPSPETLLRRCARNSCEKLERNKFLDILHNLLHHPAVMEKCSNYY
jgi:hypothetical protein